jgi:hypothetical protein
VGRLARIAYDDSSGVVSEQLKETAGMVQRTLASDRFEEGGATKRALVPSSRFPLIPLQYHLFTPELRWQSRGKCGYESYRGENGVVSQSEAATQLESTAQLGRMDTKVCRHSHTPASLPVLQYAQ